MVRSVITYLSANNFNTVSSFVYWLQPAVLDLSVTYRDLLLLLAAQTESWRVGSCLSELQNDIR